MASIYKVFEWALRDTTDVTVAVSAAERALGEPVIGRRWPWSSRKDGRPDVRVIPNGVDLGRFTPQGAVALRSSEPLVVCVGRLARQKGQDVAVEALARMATGTARLRLVGSSQPEQHAALVELASRLGVLDRVELFGPSDDPAAHFRSADVVVLPSRWEAMSLSLIEAMACGTAVVASAVAGTELLANGAGVLVPPGDPTALAGAVDQLLADPAWRQQLAGVARQRAESEADLAVAVAANLRLWDEVVLAGRPR
jgi:glycosyltransferase involved in cell wall biosynthesis